MDGQLERPHDFIKTVEVKEAVDCATYEELAMPDLRCVREHDKEICAEYGIKYEPPPENFPKVTTLGEKAKYKGHKDMLALAGVIKAQRQGAFEALEKQIRQAEDQISMLTHIMKKCRQEITFVKRLIVIDDE